MVDNLIMNASGLDGVAGWSAGSSLQTNEVSFGAPGRRVFTATHHIINEQVTIPANTSRLYFFAHHFSDGYLAIRFQNNALEQVGPDNYFPRIRQAKSDKEAYRGIPSTFHYTRGSILVPSGATKVQMFVTASVGSSVALFRPYLGVKRLCNWVPGAHFNPDLNLPVWPGELPSPSIDNYQAQRTPTRKSFTGDDGVASFTRITGRSRFNVRCEFMLNGIERDTLERFLAEASTPFWFVRPDTFELCFAQWLEDGEPNDNGIGPGRRTSFGLQLDVS